MPLQTKLFNGKKYILFGEYTNKKQAQDYARSLKSRMGFARITEIRDRPYLWGNVRSRYNTTFYLVWGREK